IDKGARWSTDIAKELQDASFGILCVTKDNLSSAWLNFEAGALSKSIEQSKVCPFLVDLKPSDIQNHPILQFQMASTTKDDVFRLFKSINANSGDTKLGEEVLSTTFETFWPKIEDALKSASINDSASPPKKSSKDTQASLEEILELVRYQHKLLKSPEELLPASYLGEAFRQFNRSEPKELLYEIDEQVHVIDMLAADVIKVCEQQENSDESTECAKLIWEIRTRARRLNSFIRRRF
ncbi:MAG: hypothetical protein J1E60_08500, partial [Christensenellaceae bacterium]|nr:hypothetical protein [Christensenellaceae bacterium]